MENALLPDRRLVHDWFHESVPANVSIGDRSWLYSSFAFRHYMSRRSHGVEIGHDTGLYNGTFFDLGPDGEVVIGSYCTLVGAIICSNSRVVIRDYAFIAHEVVLADHAAAVPFDEQIAAHAAASSAQTESIVIGENVWIGARAIILRGARIGEGSIVGAAAAVDFEVPPFSIVVGNPARILPQRAS